MDSLVYRQLPGRGFGLFRRHQVWLAEDHLLNVRSSRFIDVYERFYFGDIQGLHFRNRFGEYLLVLTALLVPCLSLLALGVLVHWAWFFPFVPFAAWTAAYARLGPEAECQIQTCLGLHPLPAINRRWTYDHLLNELAPLIQQAQGEAPEGQTQTPPDLPPAPGLAPPPMQAPAKPLARNLGYFFEAAFGAIAIASLLSLWNQRASHGVAIDWLEYAFVLSAFLLSLFGLARAYRVDVGAGVLASLWSIIVGEAAYGVLALAGLGTRITTRALDPHPLRASPAFLPMGTGVQIICLVAAVVGLFLILARKNREVE
ncbi:MAG: hypothetical protein K2X03_19185 [Bryobacteraceae bacterium]|nr:hypothetical protein [Bryobacteraceae bacterium]